MSGNFLRTYEAELQDRVPGIRRKIGIQALLNAMRSRTLQRNYALQAPQVPVIDRDGDIVTRPIASFSSWDNYLWNLFGQSIPMGARPELRQALMDNEIGWPTHFPLAQGFQNPTNYWIQIVLARLRTQFKMAIRRARKRLQNRYLQDYSSGNPLVDLF